MSNNDAYAYRLPYDPIPRHLNKTHRNTALHKELYMNVDGTFTHSHLDRNTSNILGMAGKIIKLISLMI